MEIEKRASDVRITGYVNAVGRESRVLHDKDGEFIEIIEPRTFAQALEHNAEVGLMFNHIRDLEHSSFTLEEDNIGLKVDVVTSDPEVMDKAERNLLSGWSFGFNGCECEWETRDDGMRIRHVRSLNLIEVSLLDCTPAYYATSVEVREQQPNNLDLYKLKLEFINEVK